MKKRLVAFAFLVPFGAMADTLSLWPDLPADFPVPTLIDSYFPSWNPDDPWAPPLYPIPGGTLSIGTVAEIDGVPGIIAPFEESETPEPRVGSMLGLGLAGLYWLRLPRKARTPS